MRKVGLSAVVACAACAAPPSTSTVAPAPGASLVARAEPDVLLPNGRVAVRSVVVTDGSACALLADASVWCWGALYGAARAVLARQIELPPVVELVATGGDTYARTQAGDVFVWGKYGYGDALVGPAKTVGDGVLEVAASVNQVCFRWADAVACRPTALVVRTPLPGDGTPIPALPAHATGIAVERATVCAATAEGVTCGNAKGTEHVSLAGVVDLASSSTLTCARTKDGQIVCWFGDDLRVETHPFGDAAYVALEASEHAICARTVRGVTTCIHENPTTSDDKGAVPFEEAMRGHKGATSVSLGDVGGCFVEAGVAWCWGPPEPFVAPEPAAIDLGDLASLRAAREIAAGRGHVCVLGEDDVVRCFGVNTGGALGVEDIHDRVGPERVAGLPKIAHVAARGDLTCAITKTSNGEEGGRLFCWGTFHAEHGQRCQPIAGIECVGAPALVTTGVASVAIGEGFACALDGGPGSGSEAGAGVRCWGDNAFGQLGAGDFERSKTPRVVVDPSGAALTGVKQITAGPFHACALLVDGGVDCWGYDDPGVQGRAVDPSRPGRKGGAARPVATPVPMPGKVAEVSPRCARMESGETWCWGRHPNGDFAVVPARVGACDVTSVREDCVLGASGVACTSRSSPRFGARPYDGRALASWAVSEDLSCAVEADHRATCRLRASGEPTFGAGGPPLAALEGSDACPMDPATGEGAPLVLWARSTVSAYGTTRALDDEEVRGLADAWAKGTPMTCGTAKITAHLQFDDASGQRRLQFRYLGSPCEALEDTFARDTAPRALGPAGRATMKKILAGIETRKGR